MWNRVECFAEIKVNRADLSVLINFKGCAFNDEVLSNRELMYRLPRWSRVSI